MIPALYLHFDGINNKKFSFSNYITHQTAYLMLTLWNICYNMFLPKTAQAEKNVCLTAALLLLRRFLANLRWCENVPLTLLQDTRPFPMEREQTLEWKSLDDLKEAHKVPFPVTEGGFLGGSDLPGVSANKHDNISLSSMAAPRYLSLFLSWLGRYRNSLGACMSHVTASFEPRLIHR